MTSSVQPIAIIPARGNSKRLPRKNILPWKGIPLIGHCIINALATKLFSEVIVSSEDQEILEISERYGARALKREAGLSKDNSTVAEVCLDVMSNYEYIHEFCCIYPTSIFLTSDDGSIYKSLLVLIIFLIICETISELEPVND